MDSQKQGSNRTESGDPTATVEPMVDPGRRVRQAVVVIHGIGEQRPMDTLRGFVKSVLSGTTGGHGPKYRSKPDVMNDLLETRCLQSPGSRDRPLTDFYEYYWAHHMKDSRYSHVIGWLLQLMFRRPHAIPQALRPIYRISWGLLLFGLFFLLWAAYVEVGSAGAAQAVPLRDRWPILAGIGILVTQWLGSTFILGYVADAARYLSPSPGNIEARNKIRSEGIKLLRSLHESGKYRRIVVVGHSLGSVIGYDLIRTLWVDLRKPVQPCRHKQSLLDEFLREARQLESGTATSLEPFQQSQHNLWQEFRVVGIPWLVTDFITLGSPLAHAQLLMADNGQDFAQKKMEYEFPTCPPGLDEAMHYRQDFRVTRDGKPEICNVAIPHHGAPFSCTRWSNLYFPYHHLVFGDLVGGPLAPVFGKGIRDIAVVPCLPGWINTTLVSHVKYWAGAIQPKPPTREEPRPALNALVSTLRMDFLRGSGAKIVPGAREKLPKVQPPPQPPADVSPAPGSPPP